MRGRRIMVGFPVRPAGRAVVALLIAAVVAGCGSGSPSSESDQPAPASTAAAASMGVGRSDPKGDARPPSNDITEVQATRDAEGVTLTMRLAGKPFVNQPDSDATGTYAVQLTTSDDRTWTVMVQSTVDGDNFAVAPPDPSSDNPVQDISGAFTGRGWTAVVPAEVLGDARPLQVVFVAEYGSLADPGTTDNAPNSGALQLP